MLKIIFGNYMTGAIVLINRFKLFSLLYSGADVEGQDRKKNENRM